MISQLVVTNISALSDLHRVRLDRVLTPNVVELNKYAEHVKEGVRDEAFLHLEEVIFKVPIFYSANIR